MADNTYALMPYGDQVWTVANAEKENYRDGTEISQVTDGAIWKTLTTGA